MAVSAEELKNVMSRVAATVTVVAVATEDGPKGVTVSSFTSVSADPPIVLVCMAKGSGSQQSVVDAPGFTVNVMPRGAEDVAMAFATRGADGFEGTEWRIAVNPGAGPVLESALAHLECLTIERVDIGDHWVVYGAVVGSDVVRDGVAPLVWLGRGFVNVDR